jgi:sulfite exporter TauE/SafE
MCGPIVISFSLNLKEKSIFIPHLLYHLGRITTYAILGGVVAAAGSLTMITANIDTIQKGVMIFTGALIMLMGLAMAGWIPLGKIFGDHAGSPHQGVLTGMGLMAAFGIGTVPALFLVAKLADMGWLKSKTIIYKVGAILMIVVGSIFVVKAIRF